ncbi:outer membrane protein, cobalt-zinc-cadmium efflux system [Gracilimonas mengyeensis]|uniref:Outer membrane protein, cobalt-zinc-cadmium efflux system n=2 Tax=Gracilimonas mengyeensis TaxID=1302730 RepID=A0A521BYB9_9BACT|nr:outer membrane protein, cobalt-zinc-cadmium efflux system [Gracilimonas mengyeensis]
MLFQMGTSPADTADILALSVEKALEIAYRQHPQINILQQQIVAQQKQQVLSWGLDDPQINYFKEGINDGAFMEQRWSITQGMDFPLSSYYRVKQEKATTESLQLKLDDLRNQVKADVKASYTRLAYTLQSGKLAREQVGLFEDLKRAAQARADMGESSEIDAMQADLQLQEARNSMESTFREIMNARYDLFQSIGLDPEDQTYDISFPDTLEYLTVVIDQEEVMNRLQDHPKLKQMQQQVSAAAYQVKVAKSAYLPDLNMSYYRQDFGNDYDFYGFEVGLSIPLWFAAKQSPKVQQAHAMENAAQWQYEDIRLLIKKQAEQTWHSYETAKTNIERFKGNIQAQSQELVQMTQTGYSMGELDLLTLLEAQRTYLRTQEAYYRTLRDYYLTIIELERFLQNDIIFN